MVRPRAQAARNQPEVDWTGQMAEMRQLLQAQQQEMNALREQLARQNQAPPAGGEPAHEDPPAREDPPAAGGQNGQEIPPAPIAHVEVEGQDHYPAEDRRWISTLERFRRMKAPEFHGSTDPIEADNWLTDVQVDLNLMRLNDHEKVLCASYMLKKEARRWWQTVELKRNVDEMTWQDFIEEFNERYFNLDNMAAQEDEFNNFRQGNLSVVDAVQKFKQLARLCPHMVTSEREEVNQNREERAKFFQAKKEEKAKGKQNPETQSKGPNSNPSQGNKQQGQGQNKRKGNFNPGNQKGQPQKKNNAGQVNNSFPTCNKCGKKHLGECKAGTNICFTCGKEGHFSKDCYSNPQNRANQNQQRVQNQPRASGNQLHAIQATIDGPQISQGRLEAPEPQARIYAYTMGDTATGTSTVVTGQLPVANHDAYDIVWCYRKLGARQDF
ncbi:uncharacterized protein LOC112090859 [Morus notabilis]|uniref:uncharacterized protein LOC112090859 n=1 Tax=Morus notabilis TaxID=981085 RepID=UPI000CECF9E2|nr:uncharacterized protein LOC112090859 [Morus notabilis]